MDAKGSGTDSPNAGVYHLTRVKGEHIHGFEESRLAL